MNPFVLVVAAVVVCVILEIGGVKLYRCLQARKKAAFTKNNLGTVYDDLQNARSYFLAEKNSYDLLAQSARVAGQAANASLLKALAESERAHLSELEKFREPLHAESVNPKHFPALPTDMHDALYEMAQRTNDWCEGACCDARARARFRGYRDIAKFYRQVQEVEQNAASVCAELAENACPDRQVSYCPSCGLIVFGRRPAFCTVCAKAGFEFEDVAVSASQN